MFGESASVGAGPSEIACCREHKASENLQVGVTSGLQSKTAGSGARSCSTFNLHLDNRRQVVGSARMHWSQDVAQQREATSNLNEHRGRKNVLKNKMYCYYYYYINVQMYRYFFFLKLTVGQHLHIFLFML